MKSSILTTLIASLIAIPSHNGGGMVLTKRQDSPSEPQEPPQINASDKKSQISMIPEAGQQPLVPGEGQVEITANPPLALPVDLQELISEFSNGQVPTELQQFLVSNHPNIKPLVSSPEKFQKSPSDPNEQSESALPGKNELPPTFLPLEPNGQPPVSPGSNEQPPIGPKPIGKLPISSEPNELLSTPLPYKHKGESQVIPGKDGQPPIILPPEPNGQPPVAPGQNEQPLISPGPNRQPSVVPGPSVQSGNRWGFPYYSWPYYNFNPYNYYYSWPYWRDNIKEGQ